MADYVVEFAELGLSLEWAELGSLDFSSAQGLLTDFASAGSVEGSLVGEEEAGYLGFETPSLGVIARFAGFIGWFFAPIGLSN